MKLLAISVQFFIIYSIFLFVKPKNPKIEILRYLSSIRGQTRAMKILKIKDVRTPERGTSRSAGIDFFVPNAPDFIAKDPATGDLKYAGSQLVLMPGESALIPSGIKVCVPPGYALVAFNKSGVCTKKTLIVGAEVVDEDYTGEVHMHVINAGQHSTQITAGDKLIQFMLIEQNYLDVEVVHSEEQLYLNMKSERGDGGFGSTGN